MLFQVVMLNGRAAEFVADEVEVNEEEYIFTIGGDVVAEFERRNIAGYISGEEGEDA